MLKLYDTLTKKITPFKPAVAERVTMYTCGPTVYSYAHIGNMRAYLFMDLLRRALKASGFKINGVMNITDVGHLTSDADTGEDKMALASRRENKDPWEIAEFYTNFFLTQTQKLNIDMPEHLIRATDEISKMIEMVEVLIKNGFAYETSKGVYYDISRFKNYGSLSGLKLEDKLAGARIAVDPEKRNPADFALWVKAAKEHIMQWDSPWGKGYPGWHIECSAIGIATLGNVIDIHTGGIDHVSVHHENEIAQNFGYCQKQVVNRWMHVEFLQIDGGKMSKSLDNFYTINDLENKGYRALDFKYFCYNAHYSKKINFTFEALDAAHVALTRLYEQALLHANGEFQTPHEKLKKYELDFYSAINSDLNAPLALSVVWKMLRGEKYSPDIYELLLKFDEVLGLKVSDAENDAEILKTAELFSAVIPGDVVFLAEKRLVAKKDKNYGLADAIRAEIMMLGYEIKDTKEGYEIKKCSN